jgi:hypothetical protein
MHLFKPRPESFLHTKMQSSIMQTPVQRYNLRTPASIRSASRQRPSRLLTALRTTAKSAPYAYSGRYFLPDIHRPATPPTPTPPPRAKEARVAAETIPLIDHPATCPPETKSIPLHQRISIDPMKFSLYDATKDEYLVPTDLQINDLRDAFPSAVDFRFQWPLIIVRCSEPPEQVPLTVAGVPALFLPANDPYELIPGTPGHPRVADYLAEKPYNPHIETQFDFCQRVLATLRSRKLSPLSASLYLGTLVVELEYDIPPSSLPGRLGGVVPYYCNGKSAWKNRDIRQSRLITPMHGTVDASNYSSTGITPGVRVCGIGYAGTSGLLLRNRLTAERRLMVANHIFRDTDDVYHPTTSPENHIGKVTHRYPNLDIALVQLDGHVTYNNDTYFDAPMPKKLMTRHYRGTPGQEWFFVDSPFTGLVPFLWAGVRVGIRDDLPQPFHSLKYDEQYVFLSMHINVGRLAEGVCGSPVVHDECLIGSESDGAVIGLFSWSDQNIIENLFVSVMDEIVADGWDVESSSG